MKELPGYLYVKWTVQNGYYGNPHENHKTAVPHAYLASAASIDDAMGVIQDMIYKDYVERFTLLSDPESWKEAVIKIWKEAHK